MIRFYCNVCKNYFEGGAEDKKCPVCGATNIRLVEVW